jgi:hypothetical protein
VQTQTAFLRYSICYGPNTGSGPAPDGNWNTVGNWYFYPGFISSSSNIPAVAAGRLPNPATDEVIIFSGTVSTGPTGGYSGSVTVGGVFPYVSPVSAPVLAAGNYSGIVTPSGAVLTIRDCTISGILGQLETRLGRIINSTFTNLNVTGTLQLVGMSVHGNSATNLTIADGTYGAVKFILGNPSSATGASLVKLLITGGTWVGPFAIVGSNGDWLALLIRGGTYSPAATIHITPTTVTGIPADVGFAFGGGTFSPDLTLQYSGFTGGSAMTAAQVQQLQTALAYLKNAAVFEWPPQPDWLARIAPVAIAVGFAQNTGQFHEAVSERPLSALLAFVMATGRPGSIKLPLS